MMPLVFEVLRLVVTAEQEQDKIRLNGQPYRKLVERNGKPLSEKESKQVQDNMRKTARGLFSRTYRMNVGKLSDLENTHGLTRKAEVVGPGSQFKSGTTIQIDFKGKFGGGKQIHTFTNYRKFDAESTINFEDPK